MSLLLDTCSVLWIATGDERLSPETRERLTDPAGQVFTSAITSAELACLVEKEKIQLPVHWRRWFRNAISSNGWSCLPIDLETIEEAYSLPGDFHADPADRIMVATARLNRLTIVTGDEKITGYPHVTSIS
jgi:PIN domain nuclease of toxin-antitoxin system